MQSNLDPIMLPSIIFSLYLYIDLSLELIYKHNQISRNTFYLMLILFLHNLFYQN